MSIAQKTYELSELIDIAQRTNPETRVAWERARQAAIAVGLAEGTYYPGLAAAATAAVAHVPLPIPTTVVPGGSSPPTPTSSSRRSAWSGCCSTSAVARAAVDAAQALAMEANVGFNAKHQQIVFDVTRNFYSLDRRAREGGRRPCRARLRAQPRRGGRRCASNTRSPRCPRSCRRRKKPRGRPTSSQDALAAEHDARMALLESIGIRPGDPDRGRRRVAAAAAAGTRGVGGSGHRSRAHAATGPDRATRRRPRQGGRGAQGAGGLLAQARRFDRRSPATSGELKVDDSPYQGVARPAVRCGVPLRVDAVRRLRATQPGAPRRVAAARGGGRAGARARTGGSRGVEGLQRHQGRPGQATSGRGAPHGLRKGVGQRRSIPTSTDSPRFRTCASRSAIWRGRGPSIKRRAPKCGRRPPPSRSAPAISPNPNERS